MNKILIGCHASMSKPNYLVGSVNESLSYGANTFMIYTGAPQNSIRTPINNLKIKEFHEILKNNDISINNVIVHAPYIINIGSDNKNLFNHSLQILKEEINRTNSIGCKYLIIHPGNAINIDKQKAIENIAQAINSINNTNVVICLETMAGKGNEVGSSFREIKSIIDLIKNKSNIGVCLDTCHIHDAGYDINGVDQIINEFDQTIGLKYLNVIHINDSKNKKGDKKDRHENIGYGNIGFSNFVHIVHHHKLMHIPKILETP
jgi:deoxyribonuclease-4